LAVQSAAVSSQTSPASPQTSFKTIQCLFLNLSNHPLDALNSLFPSHLFYMFMYHQFTYSQVSSSCTCKPLPHNLTDIFISSFP
jgi:hypothetical protein